MKIAINQPTYLPWLGYFDLIDQVDLFVILDNVQFEKQSWQQRNRIKTASGLQWLTVPVKFRGRFGQLISDVEIRDQEFWRNHLRAIELAYRRSAYFEKYFPSLKTLLEELSARSLLELNLGLLRWLLNCLDIRTPLVSASSLGQNGRRTELLANICKAVGATEYISPIGSAAYLLSEQSILTELGIEIQFQNYEHPIYKQLFPPFQPYASVVDLLFNEGEEALQVIRSGRSDCMRVDELLSMAQTG